MAGSIATLERSSNFRGLARDIFQKITYLSDDVNGSVPSQDLISLDDCLLTEIVWEPDDTATPANTFEVRIEKKVGGQIVYLSGSIDATAFARMMTTNYTGNWPIIDGTVTVKLVSPADHESNCNIGNEKAGVLTLRFNKKS